MRAILVACALAVGFAAVALLNRGDPEVEAVSAPASAAEPAECGSVRFDRYDVGPDFDGTKKTDTVRMCEPDTGAPTGVNKWVTMYGVCDPASNGGACAPPLQIASWPACERNLALYEKYPAPDGTAKSYTRTTIRGVPAAIFDGGRQIEVYTAATTIVVFSEKAGLAKAAATRLTGVHDGRRVTATEDLPAPVEGALAGDLTC
jgi:hypothetical protein